MPVMEVQLVQHPDLMDDDTFCKHMNARHQRSLGGLSHIWANPATEAWRAFHDRLHALFPANLYPQVSHEHGDL